MQPEQSTDEQPTVLDEAQLQPELEQPAAEIPVESDDFDDAPEGNQPIQWQAPEYTQEHRSPWWFIAFWVVTIVLMAVAAFLIKSVTFAILIPVMAAALMMYSHRAPRLISYVLSAKGVYINEKLHAISEFRSFGVSKDDVDPTLVFIPTKRFRPALTVHFPAELGEQIVDTLGARMPMQDIRFDAFDQLIRKLHL